VLASQLIGFVAGDGNTFRGYVGVEGYYQDQLAGRVRSRTVRNIPTEFQLDNAILERGSDLVLTIDRDTQFLVETVLQQALAGTGATSGTIIVMNPRNGDILAMASLPTFDPNNLPLDNARILQNPAIQAVYEPGSVFKVLTAAAALEAGNITPNWTYNDQGSYQVGSRTIYNWDRVAHGETSLQTMLVDSLNVGAATIAVEAMGRDEFYRGITRFGIGSRTRVDLEGEEAGILKVPNVSPDWSESDLGTNSYGQGVSVTPLQMLTAVNAIANRGVMMRPRVVQQIVNGVEVTNLEPVPLQKAISEETARVVAEMMVAVVRDGIDGRAALPGYTIAGKTGTAEIPLVTGGYSTSEFIMTFVGFLPADDPQISILVKLDRPTSGSFASQTAAPVFRQLVERLVIMMEIPDDETRRQLAAQGGDVNLIRR
jgi:cell division protein FtsI/penicillin-binding protein 2